MSTKGNDTPTRGDSQDPSKDDEMLRLREEVSRLQLTVKVLREDQQYSNDWTDALRYEMRNLTADNLKQKSLLTQLSKAASPEFLAALNDVQTFLGFKAPEADKS